MVRVKGGLTTKRKHKKVLKLARGYWMTRSKQIGKAKEAVLHAGEYAFLGRKRTKRNMRALWIVRLNAALHKSGISYSKFIPMLRNKKVEMDRKVLSQIAAEYPAFFDKIVEAVK
jgi:large subunit ribosomal protein L20